jgi:hypothetical protein
MNSRGQSGNVLFLILIAVALFAALSYAVSNSNRGSGDVSAQKAAILAASVIQYADSIYGGISRLRLGQKFDQVYFSATPQGSGTVYLGNNVTSTGKIVGLFNGQAGVLPSNAFPDVDAFVDKTDIKAKVILFIKPASDLFGNEIGTFADDTYIVIRHLKKEVCAAINFKATGSDVIQTGTSVSISGYQVSWSRDYLGAEAFSSGVGATKLLLSDGICLYQLTSGATYNYYKIIDVK